MKFRPNIMGKKNKAIRIDPTDLDEFRQGLKADPQWAKYADCTDSELVRMAFIMGGLYVQPSVVTLPLGEISIMVKDAVSSSIARVAAALGAVAMLNDDGTIALSHPDWDSIETFKADPPKVRPAKMLH